MFISIETLIILTSIILIVFTSVFSIVSWLLNVEASKIFNLYQEQFEDLLEVSNHWQKLAKDYAKIIKNKF
jgi:hypothetical protein